MDPLLQKAMKYKFPDDSDSRSLEYKDLAELKDDLTRLQELDDQLNPQKKRTFNGKDVALSLFGGGVFSAVTYAGLSAAGAVFTLANPIAGLAVFGMAVGGTYLSGRMTADNNKTQAFEEWDVKVVKPKLYVMRMLNEYDALTEEQKAEYRDLKSKVKNLKERDTRFTEDLGKARGDVEGLSREKQELQDLKQQLEETSREQLDRIRAQDEHQLEQDNTERLLRSSLEQREKDLVTEREAKEESLARIRIELEAQSKSAVDNLKKAHKAEQARLQTALDAEKHFRVRANNRFLLDKQHDIESLKVQRDFW